MSISACKSATTKGFTLIELSIVLVIIGLIVGGVLAGQDLIKAAAARAQVTQIEKYNTAVNTFRGKYNALPGDMNAATATAFGFASRGTTPGKGDGNGVIQGFNGSAGVGYWEGGGETSMFWADLTGANGQNINMIDGNFLGGSSTSWLSSPATGSMVDLYLPQAKIGGGNYVYVWSGGFNVNADGLGDQQNYYGLSAVTSFGAAGWQILSNPGLSEKQAQAIDTKMDDGLPLSGNVIATWINITLPNPSYSVMMTLPYASNSSSCFDNGNNSSASVKYTLTVNGGNNINCGLSFKFQ